MSTTVVPLTHVSFKDTVNQDELLDALCKERRNDFKQSTRDKLSLMSRSIEVEAYKAWMMRFMPQYQGPPYGLPPNWSESGREQVWEIILKHVDKPMDVLNLTESCVLFQRLLKDKYSAAKLSEVVELCVKHKLLPSKTLLDLRLVSRTAKDYIDDKIMKGRQSEEDGFLDFLIPGLLLWLDSSEADEPRLGRVLSSLEAQKVSSKSFPIRGVIVNEKGRVALQPLRSSVQRLFELVGHSIRSLDYHTEQNSADSYNILRRWVSLLPNLEEITVEVHGSQNSTLIKPFEHFPSAPHLRCYWENARGFLFHHLAEILGANPTLEVVKLSRYPENRLDSLMTEKILDRHKLQMFMHRSLNLLPFLGRQIKWPLVRLKLLLHRESTIPASTLFAFLNQFGETLKELAVGVVAVLSIQNETKTREMTMMNLPNLVKLQWRLATDSEPLNFMIPLKKLEYFDIYVPEQSPRLRIELGKRGTLRYLGKFHVPKLYPAMRRIQATGHNSDEDDMKTIWECGNDVA